MKKCFNCKKEITEKYQLCNLLNTGTYSNIYLICDMDEIKYIGKQLLFENDKEFDNYKIINDLDLPFLLKFYYKKNNIIIYEFIKGYDLNYYLYKYYSYKYILNLFKQIINTLFQLEKKQLYHLDINLNNILFNNNSIKIIDYGFLSHNSCKNIILAGSYGYTPPEYFLNNKLFIDKFDVFSLGIILFQFIFLFNPLKLKKYYYKKCWLWCNKKNCERNKCLAEFITNNINKQENNDDKYLIKKILLNCLHFNHNKRISIKKLYELIN